MLSAPLENQKIHVTVFNSVYERANPSIWREWAKVKFNGLSDFPEERTSSLLSFTL